MYSKVSIIVGRSCIIVSLELTDEQENEIELSRVSLLETTEEQKNNEQFHCKAAVTVRCADTCASFGKVRP